MKRNPIILLGILMSASPALAWQSSVEGPDVFGTTKAFAVEMGLQAGIILQCDSGGELLMALTVPKKEFDPVDERPAEFYLATNNEAPRKFSAKMREWNDSRIGVVVQLEDADRKSVLEAIGGAKGQIKVGVDIGGNRVSENFSSRGSTAAMKRLADGCNI